MKKLLSAAVVVPLVLLSCSRAPEGRPSTGTVAPSNADGAVRSAAVGDVKVGNGALEMFNVRMDRQDPKTGASIFRQYANPNGVYTIAPGEQIELWVEYRGANNPRVRVDWGAGEPDRNDGHICGACRLLHTYPRIGTWTVVVSLDDLAGTTVTRTFVINSRTDDAATLSVGFANTASCGEVAHLTAPGIDCTLTSSTTSGTCSASYSAGTTVTITFSVTGSAPTIAAANPHAISFCTAFNGWTGACSSVGTGAGNSGSCTLTLPSGLTATTLKTVNSD